MAKERGQGPLKDRPSGPRGSLRLRSIPPAAGFEERFAEAKEKIVFASRAKPDPQVTLQA